MDKSITLKDLSKPGNLQQLVTYLQEAFRDLDIIYTETAPNGSLDSRQGATALYNNSGTYTTWVNIDGATTWQQIDIDTNLASEEGTWTAVLGGSGGESGQSYADQGGTYKKVGKIIVASCYINLTTKGTITGDLRIKGLPFTSYDGSGRQPAASFSYLWKWTLTSGHRIMGHVSGGNTFVLLMESNLTGDTPVNLATGAVENGTRIIFSIVYFVA